MKTNFTMADLFILLPIAFILMFAWVGEWLLVPVGLFLLGAFIYVTCAIGNNKRGSRKP